MKPANVKSNTYTNSSKELNDEDLKFKIGDIVRISKYKNIFEKPMFRIGLKRFFCGHMLLTCDINVVGTFCEKELQKTDKKQLRVEKVIKKKARNYMLSGKAAIVLLKVVLTKKTQYK